MTVAALPTPAHQTVQAIYRLHEQREAAKPPRAHLGASVIGHACERYLWLHFRWAGREVFDGRMLRLFEYGHRLEERLTDELRDAGIEVHAVDDSTGQQWRVHAIGGHFGGSMDGAAVGFEEAPKTWHVLEFKSSSGKLFAELQAKGVREAKPQHWAQMQVYMGLTGMERAFYLVENKDTSALYQERIEFDAAEFDKLMQRARRVITATEPPQRLSEDPAWFACKWCHFHPQCHGQAAPAVNCRTCAHSTPMVADTDVAMWVCERPGAERTLALGQQMAGCEGHRYIPILLERIGQQTGTTSEPDGNAAVSYRTPAGEAFANGAPPNFSSREIHAAKHKSELGSPEVQAVKKDWQKARVVA
jgi:hypothetical protein